MAEVLNGFDYESIHKQAGYVIKHRKRMKPEVLEMYKQYFAVSYTHLTLPTNSRV